MSYSANIIPTMTSDAAPSGISSCSTNLSPITGYGAWRAFDKWNSQTDGFCWGTNSVGSGWLQYQFPTAETITQYTLTTRNPSDANVCAPKTWTFKGSNNGTTWVTLDTQTNVTDWAASKDTKKTFPIANSAAYAYYRLDVSAGNDAGIILLGELEMMETVVPFSPDAANLIPAMTSDTAPSGVASASSEAITPACRAFNHLVTADPEDRWVISGTTGWLQYRFATAKTIVQYKLTSQGYAGDGPFAPKTWTFKGSNNGTTWVTLDTQTNVTDWAALWAHTNVFPLVNTTAYAYYRLDITASNGASNVGVGELEMMETAVAYTANLIPTMTSDTAPSGVVTSSGDYAPYAAWRAFDHLNTSAASWVAAGTTGWIGYQFPAAHIITQYAVTSRNEGVGETIPKTWTFKGSNDGAEWVTLDTQADVTDWASSFNVRKAFSFTNTTAYAYYRIDITAANGSGYVGVGELEMMETVAGTVPLAAIGNIALAGSADILGFFAVVGLDASGTIELAGSADIFGFSAVVGMDASGSISLAGSASIVLNLAFLEADGTISLEGEYADLCQWEPMVAVGTIALCGEAWLSDALHGEDTLQAIGTIMLRCRAVRLSTGEVLPPTDDLGWTLP